MKEWLMPLFNGPYNGIASSEKDVEGRVPDPSKLEKNYVNMQVGDVLVFYEIDESTFKKVETSPEIRHTVSFVHHYDAVEDMLNTEGLHNLVPDAKNLEDGVKEYMGFPGYPERIVKHGVYAIGLGEYKK